MMAMQRLLLRIRRKSDRAVMRLEVAVGAG
jgi:hypothetical protein